MKSLSGFSRWLPSVALGLLLTACAATTDQRAGAARPDTGKDNVAPTRISFQLPQAWGGAVQCLDGKNCFLIAVEHELSKLVLMEFDNGKAVVRDQQPLGYHPDSAIWLTPDIVAAAVETGGTLDFFAVNNNQLKITDRRGVGFAPRDVLLVANDGDRYTLLATPYSGKNVAWLTWDRQNPEQSQLKSAFWCEAPWHPVHVKQLPQNRGAGIAVACLDDKKVIAVPASNWQATPEVLATFDVIPRQAKPSPSGRWLYVALETGGKNARIDMHTGELQFIQGDPRGASSVLALTDDLVIWGDSQRLTLQKLDAQGQVLDTREIKTSGYSTELQLHDINRDGVQDILVLNSTGETADVIFGPIWKD
ncbi:MAG: hypothetical protein JSR53_03480 [Proteobacteria bacterium]|nr:hypothetical protein [Pseudomonadota bacterium]